ncbi:hypothetical protein [Sphingopyxis panaciterrae]
MRALIVAGAAAMTFTSTVSAATKPPPKPQTILVSAPDCLITATPPPAGETQRVLSAIIAIVGPILVELAIDAVAADLKKIRTVKSEGSLDLNLWKRTDDKKSLLLNVPPCFTVITGDFTNEKSIRLTKIDPQTAVGPDAPVTTMIKRLGENEIAATKIYSVLEVKLVPSDDRTAFTLEPLYFRSFELMPGNQSKKQGLVYNIALRGPGASPWGSVYALAPISIGEVGAGTELHAGTGPGADKLKKLATGSLVMPGMSETAFMAYWRNPSILEFMPANLQAEVVQTKKPSDAALFLASVLEKAKPKITEKVGAALNPDAGFTAKQAELDAEIALKEAEKVLADLKAAAVQDQAAIAIATLKVQKAQEKYDDLQ